MRPLNLIVGAGIVWAALTAPLQAAPSWRDFPGVRNTSYVEPNGDRALQLSIEVPAPPAAVFDALATTEGFRSWAVPVAAIDLRVGGIIETNYRSDAKLGERDNIKNQILAYLPGRLLVMRNIQAPRTFPNPDLFARTVTMIQLEPLEGGSATRVTLTNAGYGAGDGFDQLYGMFEWGDAYSLAGLRKRFTDGPTDWSKAAAKDEAVAADKTVEGQ